MVFDTVMQRRPESRTISKNFRNLKARNAFLSENRFVWHSMLFQIAVLFPSFFLPSDNSSDGQPHLSHLEVGAFYGFGNDLTEYGLPCPMVAS